MPVDDYGSRRRAGHAPRNADATDTPRTAGRAAGTAARHVHQREQPISPTEWVPDLDHGGLGSQRRQTRPAHAFEHAPYVHLDRGHVDIVGLRGDRGRGVPPDTGERAEIVGPTVLVDLRGGLPQAAGASRIAESTPRG